MDLSVVVCSYNRYPLVAQSAKAIQSSSTFDPDTMELIVVENTPAARRQELAVGPEARVVICDDVGLSNARNAGIAAAKGEIVAFVDDDAIVRDEWCGSVVSAFGKHPRAQVCGGQTVPRFSGEALPNWYYGDLAYYLSCIDWGPKSHPLEPGQWIVGANMAFRKSVFDDIGCFDPMLGRKGDASLLSNEEIAMLGRVGHEKVFYIHDMIVDHMIPDERISLEWFRKRVFWQAVSDVLSGLVHKSQAQAAEEMSGIIARAPAEHRGHRLLSYEPATAEGLKDQLDAIYILTTLMAAGMPAVSLKA